MESNGKYLCYNCFKKRDGQEGPCPYCGFDLEDNAKNTRLLSGQALF